MIIFQSVPLKISNYIRIYENVEIYNKNKDISKYSAVAFHRWHFPRFGVQVKKEKARAFLVS